MKILVTGNAGFIGSHFTDLLLKNEDNYIVGVDSLTYASNLQSLTNQKLNKNFVFYNQNIIKTYEIDDIFSIHNPDIVVHFAAETHVDNSIKSCNKFIETNILGTTSILDACKKYNTKLVHVSTDEVYGPASDIAFTEDSKINPQNPYAVTKAAAEMMVRAYNNTYGVKSIILRMCNNYGPRQHEEKFIPKLIKCIHAGNKFPLYGSGDQEREWLFVKDSAKIINSIIELENNWHANAYNISSGLLEKNINIIKLVCSFFNIDDKSVIENVNDRPGHDKKYLINSELVNSAIPFNYTSIVDGIKQTISEHDWK